MNLFLSIFQYLLIIIKNKKDNAIMDNKMSGTAEPNPKEKGIK